jgi:iron complex outermembrane recepter protein
MIRKNRPPTTLRRVGLAGQAIAMALAANALAQDNTQAPEQLKPSIVTGSYIPTAETVGPAPVQTLSNEAIQQAGTSDPLLTLKKLVPGFTGSGNYLGSVNNNVNIGAGYQAFTGESYASLRNLPTLILLDGQRMPTTALSGGQAVDLNSIPMSMIEKVEVLKDGASAIYGSDAIGGVINIITKKNYNGFEISGRYGFAVDGPGDAATQYQVSLVGGTTSENARFIAGAQEFYQNPLLTKDREIGSQSIDQLAAQNVQPPSYFSPSYTGKVQDNGGAYILASSPFAKGLPGYNPGLGTPPVYSGQAFGGGTGVSDYNTYALGHGYTAPDGSGMGPYLPYTSGSVLNTTSFGTISLLEQERRQFFANFEYDLFKDTVTVYSHFLFSDNTADGQLAPSPVTALNAYSIAIPANNPYNPFGVDLGANGAATPRVRSRFVDFGNRDFRTYSDFYNWVGGLKGAITPDYHYDVSFNYGRDTQEQQTRNAINGASLNQALIPLTDGTGSIVTDAQGRPLSLLTDANFVNLPIYNFFGSGLDPSASVNAPETINQLRTTLFTWGQSELWSGQGVFNATPFDLPAGKLALAMGGAYQAENLSIQVDGLTQQGLVPGLNPANIFSGGSRKTAAGFIEAVIPILSKDMNIPGAYALEVNAAGRYQTFDPGGDDLVPKVGIRWQPLDEQITLRASYGQGFIAPSIYNLYGPDSTSNPNVQVGGELGQVTTITRANPNLEPAESDQYNVGIVLSPKFAKNLTVAVDYYNADITKLPVADFQGAADSLNNLGSASPFASGFTFFDGTRLTTPTPGQVTVNNWGNLILPWQPNSAIKTDGLDFSANYLIPMDEKYGKISLTAVANYILSYELRTASTTAYHDYSGTYTTLSGLMPEYNITTSLTYELGGFSYTISAHYLPETSDPGLTFPEYGESEHGYTIDGKTWTIPSYFTIDMQVAYEFGKGKVEGRKWYDGTRVAVGCQNITGEKPPLIPDAVEDNTDKNNYDIIGQFVYFEVSKKF